MYFQSKHEYFKTGHIQSLILFVTIFHGIIQKASGQEAELIAESLVKAGFENTRCIITDFKCFVSIENHTFRWDVKAVSKALDLIASSLEYSSEINLVILDNALPQILVRVESTDWRSFSLGYMDAKEISGKLILTCCTAEAAQKLSEAALSNRSAGKFDLVIYPQLYFREYLDHQVL